MSKTFMTERQALEILKRFYGPSASFDALPDNPNILGEWRYNISMPGSAFIAKVTADGEIMDNSGVENREAWEN